MTDVAGNRWVRLVCTDRSGHRPALIARLTVATGPHGRHLAAAGTLPWFEQMLHEPGLQAARPQLAHVSRESYRARCPRCPRDVRIDQAVLAELVDAVTAMDGRLIDLSLLPF